MRQRDPGDGTGPDGAGGQPSGPRRGAVGCSRTFLLRGRGPPAARGTPHIRVPETLSGFCGGRRRPAAPTANFRRRRRRRLSRQMGVTCGRRGCACAPRVLGPRAAQRTRPEDERWPPRSLRVTQFSLGPRQLGVGQRQAGVHTQRTRGGRPRVRASAGGRLTGNGQRPLLVAARPRRPLRPHTHFGGRLGGSKGRTCLRPKDNN